MWKTYIRYNNLYKVYCIYCNSYTNLGVINGMVCCGWCMDVNSLEFRLVYYICG